MVTIIKFKQKIDLRRERDLGRITEIMIFWRYRRIWALQKYLIENEKGQSLKETKLLNHFAEELCLV